MFVVDDDVSVRESLELLIRCEGWQPETFESAQEFLTHQPWFRAASYLTFPFQASMVWTCRSASPPNGLTCRLSLSPATATCPRQSKP